MPLRLRCLMGPDAEEIDEAAETGGDASWDCRMCSVTEAEDVRVGRTGVCPLGGVDVRVGSTGVCPLDGAGTGEDGACGDVDVGDGESSVFALEDAIACDVASDGTEAGPAYEESRWLNAGMDGGGAAVVDGMVLQRASGERR